MFRFIFKIMKNGSKHLVVLTRSISKCWLEHIYSSSLHRLIFRLIKFTNVYKFHDKDVRTVKPLNNVYNQVLFNFCLLNTRASSVILTRLQIHSLVYATFFCCQTITRNWDIFVLIFLTFFYFFDSENSSN